MLNLSLYEASGDKVVRVDFNYDSRLVAMIRGVEGRRYYGDFGEKFWTIPFSSYAYFLKLFEEYTIDIDDSIILYLEEYNSARDRFGVFENELKYFKDEYLKFATAFLEFIPEYFFKVPASSTGKYHPSFTLGDGGLVRHTKAVLQVAIELFGSSALNRCFQISEKDKQLILVALLFHDAYKLGIEQGAYTVHEHPKLAGKAIVDFNLEVNLISTQDALAIKNLIEAHMGDWTTTQNSPIELAQPTQRLEYFVHLCDYIASRKRIENLGK